MNFTKFTFVLAMLVASTFTMAGEEHAAMDKPTFYASQSQTVTAKVEAINHETREVTLLLAEGDKVSFTAREEARNLDQVSVGDIVVAQYVTSMSVEVIASEGLEAGALGVTTMERTEKGAMPGMVAVDTEVVISKVVDINLEANTFKLESADGTVQQFTARNPDNLRRADVGDMVVISITEAVALSVEAAPAD